MSYQREICERILKILQADERLTSGGVRTFIEDDCDPTSKVEQALARKGVMVLVSSTGHRRKPGGGSSTAGDISIELSVFENPQLNRSNNLDSLTVTGVGEIAAEALHWTEVQFGDGTKSRIVYTDMNRADADKADYRMIVSFTAIKSLDAADAVRWGIDDDAVIGEVVQKTMSRGGVNVYEPGRDGNTRLVGTRDRHWKATIVCSVPASVTEDDLPELGEAFAFSGLNFVTDTAEMVSAGEDTSTVRLSGRTLNYGNNLAHGTIDFFAPADPNLGLSAEWEFQDGGDIQHSRTRAAEPKRDGDELRSKLHDGKSTTRFVYIFRQPATAVEVLTFPKVGKIAGGWHIDGFSCSWDRQQLAPKLTVNCHRHDANSHAEDSCRTYTPSLAAIPVTEFGCPADFGAAFKLTTGAVVDLRSATYAVQVSHIDELSRVGEELAGENRDGRETLSVELTGAATSEDYTSSWDQVDDGVTPTNSGATASSFTFEHHVAHDVPEDED